MIRQPAVAGSFYPANPKRLAGTVDDLLASSSHRDCRIGPGRDCSLGEKQARALVVPHAGYAYSGPVAASAYAHLASHAAAARRIVVLGPAHYVPFRGMAVPTVEGMRTPLGVVPLDEGARDTVLKHPDCVADDEPHEPEHSLEVQLPFLQRILGEGFTVLPVVVGGATADAVAEALDLLEVPDDPQTVVLVSTDLSHYLDHATAQRRDAGTAEAVVRRDAAAIGAHDACGAYPLRGLLVWAEHHDLEVTRLDLRTSGDTAGGPHRVVGYGAFAVS